MCMEAYIVKLMGPTEAKCRNTNLLILWSQILKWVVTASEVRVGIFAHPHCLSLLPALSRVV